jgi:hypothetical protein
VTANVRDGTTIVPITQSFFSSTTWTVPAGVTYVTVTASGAGGGSGGSDSSGNPGGAGGPGGLAEATVAVTPGGNLSISVGTAGANAGDGTGANGGNGGSSGVTGVVGGGGGGGGGANGSPGSDGSCGGAFITGIPILNSPCGGSTYNGYVTLSYPATPTLPPDPRRIGVSATGSYWGGAGEQIDLLSGNLNYTLALMKPQSRGWGATLALSYNSQMWRQTGTTSSNLAVDVGYGLGWTLQAGSLVPVGAYYAFRDATGATYLLDQYANGVYTSKQGAYVSYDVNANRIYFPDGSFWVMGAKSAATEPDAGTLYPTKIQDSNGNYITIGYANGNTSARLLSIMDARNGTQNGYGFQYNTDSPVPHLIGIGGPLKTSESYTLTYTNGVALQSPFDSSSFGAATTLTSVTVTALPTNPYVFQYSPGTAELTKVTTPAGGTLGWAYRTFAYSSGYSYREVTTRSMQQTPSALTNTWNIGLDSNAAGHASTTVTDNGAGTSKVWNFDTSTGPFLGLVSVYRKRGLRPPLSRRTTRGRRTRLADRMSGA